MEQENEKIKQGGLSYEELSERGLERMNKLKEALTEARKYGLSDEIKDAMDALDKALDKQIKTSKSSK